MINGSFDLSTSVFFSGFPHANKLHKIWRNCSGTKFPKVAAHIAIPQTVVCCAECHSTGWWLDQELLGFQQGHSIMDLFQASHAYPSINGWWVCHSTQRKVRDESRDGVTYRIGWLVSSEHLDAARSRRTFVLWSRTTAVTWLPTNRLMGTEGGLSTHSPLQLVFSW